MADPADPGGGAGARIQITPEDVHAAAVTFCTEQTTLSDIWAGLASGLPGGMAGDDDAAHTFDAKYTPAVNAVWTTFEACARSLGGVSSGMRATANNYIRAENASTKGGGTTPTYSDPYPAEDIWVSSADSCIGSGDDDAPPLLGKWWPKGDVAALRDAAGQWRTAQGKIGNIVGDLSMAIDSVTDYNDTECVDAMYGLWNELASAGNPKAPFTALAAACGALGTGCDAYADAVERARHDMKEKLAIAGIAVGLTTIAGVALTIFTLGGSDAGAAAADTAEVAGIVGPVLVEFEGAIDAEIGEAIAVDLAETLESVAAEVPNIEASEAEYASVDDVIDDAMTETSDAPPGEDIPAGPPEPAAPFDGGAVPSEAQLEQYAEEQGWTRVESETGPPKYYDENGVNRMTIKGGSERAPGSEGPHVEMRNAHGDRIDPTTGETTTRKSPGNHRPFTP